MPVIKTERLSADEFRRLQLANTLLTQITRRHAIWCECDLCCSRIATDVSEMTCLFVSYEPRKIAEAKEDEN